MRDLSLLDSQRRVFAALEQQVLKQGAEPPRVLLRGPSGCGKSWLIRELAERWQGPAVIAAGEPALAKRDYGALWLGISATGPKLSLERSVAQGASAAGRAVPIVGSLVAYLTELLANNRSRQRRDQTLYLKGDEFDILSHLDALARGGRLLLVADDLQYWDQDSLQLLYLMVSGRLDDVFPFIGGMSLVVTITDGQISESAAPFLDILARMPLPIQLTPVTPAEIAIALRMFGFSATLDQTQLEMLHVLSGGHLELIRQLADYLETHKEPHDLAALIRSAGTSSEKFLATILVRRLLAAGETGRAALGALEAAAVIGKTFTADELKCLLKPTGMDADQCIATAREFGLLTNGGTTFSFRHDILRNCLMLQADTRLAPSRRKFAACLSLLRPFDYFTRAEQMLGAGATEEAARLHFAGLYKRMRDGQSVPAELRVQVFDMLAATGQVASAEMIYRGHELILERRFAEVQHLLGVCENTDHPLFVCERTHLLGLATLQSVTTSERRRALATLLRGMTIAHGEKELEIRLKLTLLTAFVHLEMWNEARQLDQEICTTLSVLQRTDPGAREALEVHRRKSGMLYGSEVAAARCRRAVAYFGPQVAADWPPRNPVQSFMAQCNLSGNLVVAGEFEEADCVARAALDMWRRLPRVKMPRVEKCVNNSVIAGVLSARLPATEAVTLLEELRAQNPGGVFSRLIRSNCAVFRALSGDATGALAEFEALASEFERDGIEDEFYHYFIKSNLAGLLHVQGQSERGRSIWRDLDSHVPIIPDSDRHYLVARQKLQHMAFDEVGRGDITGWNDFLRLRQTNHLGPGWRFYGRGLLVTDTQIWLES